MIKHRRFWKEVTVTPSEKKGYKIHLDGRAVRTPKKAVLELPSQNLAEAVAREWRDCAEEINPEVMPFTRLANTAIDRIPARRSAIIEELTGYGGNDLLCYREETQPDLKILQEQQWGPLLTWLEETHEIFLQTGTGLMPVMQSEKSRESFSRIIQSKNDWELAALSELTSISGSLVIALRTSDAPEMCEHLYQASILDECFQESLWGADPEAIKLREERGNAFRSAADFLRFAAM